MCKTKKGSCVFGKEGVANNTQRYPHGYSSLVCTGLRSTREFRRYYRKLTASVLADWQSIISSSISADLQPTFCCCSCCIVEVGMEAKLQEDRVQVRYNADQNLLATCNVFPANGFKINWKAPGSFHFDEGLLDNRTYFYCPGRVMYVSLQVILLLKLCSMVYRHGKAWWVLVLHADLIGHAVVMVCGGCHTFLSLITWYLIAYCTNLQYQSMNGKDSIFPRKTLITWMN